VAARTLASESFSSPVSTLARTCRNSTAASESLASSAAVPRRWRAIRAVMAVCASAGSVECPRLVSRNSTIREPAFVPICLKSNLIDILGQAIGVSINVFCPIQHFRKVNVLQETQIFLH